MSELFEAIDAFLSNPTTQGFLRLREAFRDSDDYHPYAGSLAPIYTLLDDEEWVEALCEIDALMPNWFLNPRIHLLASTIHSQLGDQEESEMEEELASVLLEAILGTGDGNERHPYLVMRPCDEYDVVEEYFGKEVEMQELNHRDERSFDILTCKDGTVYWFDVSLLMEASSRRRAESSSAGA
jgi:hypothetical protein